MLFDFLFDDYLNEKKNSKILNCYIPFLLLLLLLLLLVFTPLFYFLFHLHPNNKVVTYESNLNQIKKKKNILQTITTSLHKSIFNNNKKG